MRELCFAVIFVSAAIVAEDEARWSHVQTPQPDEKGLLEVKSHRHSDDWWKNAIKTVEKYDGPIEITAVARTDDANIRLGAFMGAAVIVNWEVNKTIMWVARPDGITDNIAMKNQTNTPIKPIEQGKWAKIVWQITKNGIRVILDGKEVFKESRKYGDLGSNHVRIGTCLGSTIQVKELTVKVLEGEALQRVDAIFGKIRLE